MLSFILWNHNQFKKTNINFCRPSLTAQSGAYFARNAIENLKLSRHPAGSSCFLKPLAATIANGPSGGQCIHPVRGLLALFRQFGLTTSKIISRQSYSVIYGTPGHGQVDVGSRASAGGSYTHTKLSSFKSRLIASTALATTSRFGGKMGCSIKSLP